MFLRKRKPDRTPLLTLEKLLATTHCRCCNNPIAKEDRKSVVEGHGLCFGCWKDDH